MSPEYLVYSICHLSTLNLASICPLEVQWLLFSRWVCKRNVILRHNQVTFQVKFAIYIYSCNRMRSIDCCGKFRWTYPLHFPSYGGWSSIDPWFPTTHHGCPGSVPGQDMWDLWQTNWHWSRFPPSTTGFPADFCKINCCISINHRHYSLDIYVIKCKTSKMHFSMGN
jgi:hypothetical protein